MRKSVHFGSIMILIILFQLQAYSQNVTGKIIRIATNTTSNGILDPAGTPPSGYTSKSTSGFLGDDVGNAKLGFKAIPTFNTEPFGDLRRGPDHLYSDFVPDVNGNGVYVYLDGANNLIFRMRLGSIVPGAKGYSILVDTDLKFGNSGANADPNYLPATTGINGNPGFEREIVLATGGTNDGILVYNIDGNDNASALTPTIYSGWTNYSQISIAGSSDNGDPDFFLDFYVPLSSLGLTTSSQVRFSATTVMSGQAAIGGPKSDIYGLTDSNYKSTNAEWEAYINQEPPITISSLSGSGTSATSTSACTAAPVISSINPTGGLNSKGQITGTWNNFSTSSKTTATISFLINGSAVNQTVSVSAGSWSYDVPASGLTFTSSGLTATLAAGQVITAQALAATESKCLFSNSYTISGCNSWSTSGLVAPIGDNSNNNYQCFLSATSNTTSKGVGGANRTNSTWTVYVNEAINNTTKNSTTDQGQTFFSSGATAAYSTTTWNQASTPYWKYSDGCQGGSNLSNGVYTFWYQDVNGCKSDITPVCVGTGNGTGSLAGTIATTPTISPSSVTASTNSVTVTGAAGTTITLYYNGEVIGTGAISGTYNGTTTGTVTFSNLTFANGGVLSALSSKITANTVTSSYCPAKSAAQTIGICQTTAPVINADANGQITAGQAITGFSSEASGTTIKVYNSGNTLVATTTVASNGSWTTGAVTATAGTIYYATAQNSSCSVSANSSNATAANTTTNICGTINGTITELSTTVGGTLSAIPTVNTSITLYQDGVSIGTATVLANANPANWSVVVTAGTLNPNSTLTIGIRQGTNQELTCSSSAKTIVCSSPPTAPTIVSPTNPVISAGSTITYNLSNTVSDVFYGIVDANSGKSLADGKFATGNTLSLTTYPFSGTSGTVYNIQIKASSISSAAVCTNYATGNVTISGSLPVSFLSLVANKVPAGVQVNWTVTNEQNVAYYIVERSTDCVNYEVAGQVNYIATNGSENHYGWLDRASFNGKVCYRIRQVDTDGRAHYSNIVQLKTNSHFSVQVAPNPAKSEAIVFLTTLKAGPVTLQLTDMSGRVALLKTVYIQAGSNAVVLPDLQGFTRGIYTVKVNSEEGLFYQKLVLQ